MLQGYQRKYLRGLAHRLKPVVLIGQSGLTEAVLKSADAALKKHELIKIKFNAIKEKDQKKKIISAIETKTRSEIVGSIGHTAIFFREQTDPDKRQIQLPRQQSPR